VLPRRRRLIFETFTWNFQHTKRGTGAKDEPEIPALPSGASPFSGDSSSAIEASITLKPGGSHVKVTNANKREYVLLKAQKMLWGTVEAQMSAIIDAFHSLVPRELVDKYGFTPLELQMLVCGEQHIDVADLRQHCKYEDGYTGKEPQVAWFWQAVDSMDEVQRRALLQFWSGSDGMPAEGFGSLEPAFHLVSVDRMYDRNDRTARLPAAHTCFRQLDLPRYASYEELRAKMLTAITMGQVRRVCRGAGDTGQGGAPIARPPWHDARVHGFMHGLLHAAPTCCCCCCRAAVPRAGLHGAVVSCSDPACACALAAGSRRQLAAAASCV
jgi:hypothetical protein